MPQLKARRGAILVMTGIITVALCGAGAIAIDFNRLWVFRHSLQSSADAGAHAGAVQLLPPHNPADVDTNARIYAKLNVVMGAAVTIDSVELGDWNPTTRVFTAGAATIDAVRVVVSRQSSGLFMSILGVSPPRVKARAVGYAASAGGSGAFTRFLVDNEMFDPGHVWLKNLARSLRTTSDSLLTDNNGDWFVDMPAGIKAQVPTGQVGDEGLFDINHPSWPFTSSSTPSFEDFLNYNEDGTWRQGLIDKALLDPLYGVLRVMDGSKYPTYVAPGNCQVSPLYKSDISALGYPTPSVNALGLRRGLIAFTVDSVGVDPDGSGSQLPNLWITICDPASILGPGLDQVTQGLVPGQSKVRLVQ